MFIRVISRVVAFLLIAESLFGALAFTQLLPQLGIYSPLTVALILLRALVNALLFTGGWMLANRRPQGRTLACCALGASAILTVFDVGLNLAPTNIYPWLRWKVTAGYCLYAALAVLVITRSQRGAARRVPRR